MSLCVLLIEDDPASLELARYLLEAAGHTVLGATSGEDGLDLAMHQQTDLLLCDLQLPGIDGCSVARHLQHASANGQPVRIALTALSLPGDRERALQAGFHAFLSKPITPETFVATVEQLTSAHTETD